METILGFIIITFIILIFAGTYKVFIIKNHDYSGNLDKQKEDYENTFPYLINIIKSLFKNN